MQTDAKDDFRQSVGEEGMGGAQYQAKCLIEKLIPINKFEIYYLTRRSNPNFRPVGYQIIKIADVSGIRRFGKFFDARRLIKILNQIKPNLIYQRVANSYTGIAAYYARHNKCKMVWHIANEPDVLPFEGKLSFNIAFRYVEKKILEYGIAHADCIIAQTEKQGKLLQKYYGRTPAAVIPNFHPLPKEKIIKNNPVKIVWVANLKPKKQPEVFIRLARDLQVMKGAQFIMIGAFQGSTLWRENLLADMNKVNNLTYLGVQTQEQVNTILSGAHIFVNTSLFEGFPNTFIQAWMRKVSIVSLNVNPDGIFDDGRIGVCSGTYEKMKKVVIELIKDADLRRDMGTRAGKYVIDKHSEKNVEMLVQFFNN